jgi:hypothetical protein
MEKSGPVTAARLERCLDRVALEMQRVGKRGVAYLPIYERPESEFALLKAKQAAMATARKRLSEPRAGAASLKGETMSDDPRIEKAARALCRHDGRDRDAPGAGMGNVIVYINRSETPSPKWLDYIDEARKFVVVYDALNS